MQLKAGILPIPSPKIATFWNSVFGCKLDKANVIHDNSFNWLFEFFFLSFVNNISLILLSYSRFASPQVIRCYVLLLAEFRTNSQLTNHSIIKMLHRIAFDPPLVGLLFQASLFRVFSKILADPFCSSSYFEVSYILLIL